MVDPELDTADASGGWDEFVSAYRATSPEVFAYLHRLTGRDTALAEDLAADVYERSLRSWQDGNPISITAGWLITTARHRFIDHLRRADVEQRKLALAHVTADEVAHDDFLGVDAALILSAARSLPPLQRLVLGLRYVDDRSVAEIAFEIDKSVDATDAMLRRARMTLRTLIDDDKDPR